MFVEGGFSCVHFFTVVFLVLLFLCFFNQVSLFDQLKSVPLISGKCYIINGSRMDQHKSFYNSLST